MGSARREDDPGWSDGRLSRRCMLRVESTIDGLTHGGTQQDLHGEPCRRNRRQGTERTTSGDGRMRQLRRHHSCRILPIELPLTLVEWRSEPGNLTCSLIGTDGGLDTAVRSVVELRGAHRESFFATAAEFESVIEIAGRPGVGTGRGTLRIQLDQRRGMTLSVTIRALSSSATAPRDGEYLSIRNAIASYVIGRLDWLHTPRSGAQSLLSIRSGLSYPVRNNNCIAPNDQRTIMFAIDCPRHGKRVLLSLSEIVRIDNTSRGIEVHYACSCGHHGLWLSGHR